MITHKITFKDLTDVDVVRLIDVLRSLNLPHDLEIMDGEIEFNAKVKAKYREFKKELEKQKQFEFKQKHNIS